MANNTELDMLEGSGIRTAVDIMVLNGTKNRVLLGLRKAKAGENTWGFPGGHQVTGEKIAETAQRELREEIGEEAIVYLSNLVVGVRENLIPPWFVPHLTIVIEGVYQSGTIKVAESDKTVDWQWFPLGNLPTPLFSGIGELISNYLHEENLVVTDWQKRS